MSLKDTLFSIKQTINCNGRILDLKSPRIMGILNLTPDSFYDGGKYAGESDILSQTARMISEGADIIDIGGYSSRPGAENISEEEEKSRLKSILKAIRKLFPEAVLSIDTFRSGIAEYAVKEFGINIINDISAGLMDDGMMNMAGMLRVPYIMMHMKGTPQNMYIDPKYEDVVKELLSFFANRIATAIEAGIDDIIIDPGFGFGKTRKDNFTLLHDLELFKLLGYPVMVGLSRKSMIYKTLDLNPNDALNGTTVLNTLALHNGACILRVHDVKEAVQAVKLTSIYRNEAG